MPVLRPGGGARGAVGQGVLAGAFRRDGGGALRCDGVPLDAIAAAVGTPAYVYSADAVREQYGRLIRVLADVPFRVHYSLKANGNLGVLGVLRRIGSGAEVVSGGELYRARLAGFGAADIVFGGVGKSACELREAVDADILLINVESEAELRLVDAIAADVGRTARVGLRVNPEITVETPHHYTRTGERGHKFGIPYDEALDVAAVARQLPHTRLVGLDMHVGSQLAHLDAYAESTRRMRELVAAVRAAGAPDLRYLDIGGGLAVTYEEEAPTDLARFAEIVLPVVRDTGLQLIVEPGRFLVANAGVLLTRVLYRKRSGGKEYVITDAGMTDLIRPSHYHAYHRVEAVSPRGGRVRADVVGPVCESGDFLALDRDLDDAEPGDLLVVYSVGAYGFAMASNYNARPRAAEVLVDGDRYGVVREREGYADLVRLEHVEPQWRTA